MDLFIQKRIDVDLMIVIYLLNDNIVFELDSHHLVFELNSQVTPP